jgi:hypothetical protein
MEIKGEDYRVWYEATTGTVICQGSLRLAGTEEYAPVNQVLNDAAEKHPEKIILDLRELEFLNSSGINMLSKFVIKMRQQGDTEILVKGSQQIPWQGKSLKNLQRLMPKLILEFI